MDQNPTFSILCSCQRCIQFLHDQSQPKVSRTNLPSGFLRVWSERVWVFVSFLWIYNNDWNRLHSMDRCHVDHPFKTTSLRTSIAWMNTIDMCRKMDSLSSKSFRVGLFFRQQLHIVHLAIDVWLKYFFYLDNLLNWQDLQNGWF